ncbi:MAG: pyridoxine 5'-phosphate synthase [Gemmatimonadota bacterium]
MIMRLYINIDHVATLRQARKTNEPDPFAAATLAVTAGAHGITAHLREDRRHVQDVDLERLTEAITTGTLATVANYELALSPGVLSLVCRLRPYQATLVPERREEVTTEGGLDLRRQDPRLTEAIARLKEAGCRVSFFIDPEQRTIERAREFDVPAIELHTGRYAHTWQQNDKALKELAVAARFAKSLGLAVHAGHGLTYLNVAPVAAIPEIEELNIGHSIVSRAVMTGMHEAVAEMGRIVSEARTSR